MKAVMWTDTLQVIIMYAAMIAVGKQPLLYIKKKIWFQSVLFHRFILMLNQVIVKGHVDVGGWSVVWNANQATGRVEFSE